MMEPEQNTSLTLEYLHQGAGLVCDIDKVLEHANHDLPEELTEVQPSTQLLTDTDRSLQFPKSLNHMEIINYLGGGTCSTFKVQDTIQKQTFALKFGASQEQIQIEVLINVLYERLGVPVPKIQAYGTLPSQLAAELGLKNSTHTIQLAEWLEPQKQLDATTIIMQARRNFVIHAFMGNIDSTKEDNFILSLEKKPTLIDSGSNFIFKALGEKRKDNSLKVNEIDSMRNPQENPSGAQWFQDLTSEELQQQVENLISQRDTIENTIWEVSQQLELSPVLQNQVLLSFSHRFDDLAQRYGFGPEDKAASQNKTAAGALLNFQPQNNNIYRPLRSPDKVRADITKTVLKKSKVLSCIKGCHHHFFAPHEPQSQAEYEAKGTKIRLSPSELHLKTVMGHDFKTTGSVYENVSLFLNKYDTNKYSQELKEKLLQQALAMIEYERAHPDKAFFYHGTSSEISYVYSVYTSLYQIFTADSRWNALRADHALFHQCLNIEDFIAHFIDQSRIDNVLYNYQDGFMESALSCNLFIFGNHQDEPSYSIGYYTKNSTCYAVDLFDMFRLSLYPMGVDEDLMKQLSQLADDFPQKNQGALYQISLERAEASQYAYLAQTGGQINPLVTPNGETVNISDFLTALEREEVSEDYIQKVQARFMASPLSPINICTYHLGSPIDPNQQKVFNQRLALLAEDIAYSMLSHFNSFTNFNSKTALFRYLPRIYQQVGLNLNTANLTDEYMIQLVEACNFEAIKRIITTNPEYRHKPLIRKSYVKNKMSNEERSSFTLLERLLATRRAEETILMLYGDDFYEGKLDKLPIDQVIAAIKIDSRYAFATRHQDKIKNIKELVSVLVVLPEHTKFEYARTVGDKIKNINCLRQVLEVLPPPVRFPFAQSHQDKIKNGTGLLLVLDTLPEMERLQFVRAILYQIEDACWLLHVLAVLPPSMRLEFANEQKNKIEDGTVLTMVLKTLPEADAFEFASTYHHKIDNGSLSLVLGTFPVALRLEFAKAHQEKMRTSSELEEVLKTLPEERRCTYAISHIDKVRYANELASIISILPAGKKLDFAINYQDKIKDVYGLVHVLSKLPEETRFSFAVNHLDKVNDTHALKRVLGTLSETNSIDFERMCLDKHNNDKLIAPVSLMAFI